MGHKANGFRFWYLICKRKFYSHVYALSRLHFKKWQKDSILENVEDEFLHWGETDIPPINQLESETLQDLILRKIASRIKTNKWNNCSKSEKN